MIAYLKRSNGLEKREVLILHQLPRLQLLCGSRKFFSDIFDASYSTERKALPSLVCKSLRGNINVAAIRSIAVDL